MIVKICGITNAEDAAAAIDAGANAIGFNFYPRSPRYIEPEQAAGIPTPGARRVGVFVNGTVARVEEMARAAALDTVQLHGEIEGAWSAGLAIWKTAQVTGGFKLKTVTVNGAEALLLDGPAGELWGGSGRPFDWKLAQAGNYRIVIAGGLDGSNVSQAIAVAQPWGVDACSRIESAPGKKDHIKMQAFIQAALGAVR